MRRIFIVPALLALTFGACTASAQSVDTSLVKQVQEEWEVVIATPEPDEGRPADLNIDESEHDENLAYVVFNLNYRDEPAFLAGGMQSRPGGASPSWPTPRWGRTCSASANEYIQWTPRMMVLRW